MVIFNSYVTNYQRVEQGWFHWASVNLLQTYPKQLENLNVPSTWEWWTARTMGKNQRTTNIDGKTWFPIVLSGQNMEKPMENFGDKNCFWWQTPWKNDGFLPFVHALRPAGRPPTAGSFGTGATVPEWLGTGMLMPGGKSGCWTHLNR